MSILTSELLSSFDRSVVDVSEALTMPPDIYTSPEFLDFERGVLFSREWLCVGRVSRIPNVGDYFTATVNNEPIIVARAKDLSVRAFSAICQHRGMQVAADEGNCTKFTCPYHLWTYDLGGRLLGAPAMERTKDFDKKEFPLPPLKVELWQGFVFVHFNLDAEPLGPSLATYEPYLANYDLHTAVCPGTFILTDLPWNWKVMFENFNDGYHANKLHAGVHDFCRSEDAAFPVGWDDDHAFIMRTNRFTHIDGGFNATQKALLPLFPALTDEERWRVMFALVPPTLTLGFAPDQIFYFLVRPLTADTIDLEIGYLFHPKSVEDPLFEEKFALSSLGVQGIVMQDVHTTTLVQQGLHSRFAPRGRYAWQEETHRQFNRWLVNRYRKAWPTADVSTPPELR